MSRAASRSGTPYNLHHHPADAFVRDFIRSEALEEQREQVFARGR